MYVLLFLFIVALIYTLYVSNKPSIEKLVVEDNSTNFLEEEIPLEERKINLENAKKRAEEYSKNIKPIATYGIVKPTPIVFELDPTPPYYLNYVRDNNTLLPSIDNLPDEDIDEEMSPLNIMHLTNNDIHEMKNEAV